MPGRRLLRCLLLGVLVGVCAPAGADARQQLRLEVAVPGALALSSLQAEVDRLGLRSVVALADDGSTPWDIPGDGVYVGELAGDYARTVSLVLVARQGDSDHVVFAGVLRTEDASLATLGFRLLATPDGPTAVRVPMPYPGSGSETYESLQLVSAFGWGLLMLAYVATLVFGGGRRRRRSGPAAPR